MSARHDFQVLAWLAGETHQRSPLDRASRDEVSRALAHIDRLRAIVADIADNEPPCKEPDECGVCEANRLLGRIVWADA